MQNVISTVCIFSIFSNTSLNPIKTYVRSRAKNWYIVKVNVCHPRSHLACYSEYKIQSRITEFKLNKNRLLNASEESIITKLQKYHKYTKERRTYLDIITIFQKEGTRVKKAFAHHTDSTQTTNRLTLL